MKAVTYSSSKWKWMALVFAITSVAVFCLLVWYASDHRFGGSKSPSCTLDNDLSLSRSKRQRANEGNVFTAITPSEIRNVLSYMYADEDLKLKQPEEATINSSFIHLIELQPARKQEVLNYLSGNGVAPERLAKVLMFRGDSMPPVLEEYVVGPLSNISYARIVNTTARQTTIPYNFRPFSSFEFKAIYKYVIGRIAENADQVLKESYGATPINCSDKCLRFSMTPVSSAFLRDGERKAWFWFAYDIEFYTLHPLDFQYMVDMTSANPDDWEIENIWYAKQMFDNLDQFLDEYKSGSINKTVMTFPSKEDQHFSSLEFRQSPDEDTGLRPPVQVEPDGSRVKYFNGNEISHLSWDMKFRVSPSIGLELFDVKFQNERILYEISLQEVVVTYSGFSPTARMLNYADSAGLFGTRCRGLLPSVDCPSNAHFIDTEMYSANEGGLRKYENAICVFEHNTNTPLRRHRAYGRSGAFYGGLVSTVLVVRTILSVINYDYVYDFYFYQNGAVEVKIALTGYLGTSFHYPEESPYGVHIHEHINAGIHNHLFHLKVDLDVNGTSNRFETLDIKVENKTDPWMGGYHMQTYYERNVRETELEAVCNYNFSSPKYYLISSNDETTTEGLPRSYRLLPKGMSMLMGDPEYGFSTSIPWARQQVAITQHKDDELTSSSIFSMWDAKDPVVNFAKYIGDNESIVNEVCIHILHSRC